VLGRLAQCAPYGFGASSLGNLYAEMSDASAHEAVDAAWSLGVRYFDTAPYYGFGLSERRLGDALRLRNRDDYIVSTKAGRLLVPAESPGERGGFRSPMPFTDQFDYSYDGVMRSFEASLHRLGLSRVDILLLHDLGAATHGENHAFHFSQAVRGGFRALEELRAQGAVSAIGLGVNEVSICAESMVHADFDLFLVAGRFTLLDQSASAFFDTCRARGVGVIAAGVFNSGILAGGGRFSYDYAPASETILRRAEAIEDVCSAFGVALPAAALQFSASHAGVTLPLLGVRDAREVAAAHKHAAVQIPSALWQTLQELDLIQSAHLAPLIRATAQQNVEERTNG